MRILRAYVAAACLASTVFGLYDAPKFLRARQRAVNANLREQGLGVLWRNTEAKLRESGTAVVVDANGNPQPTDAAHETLIRTEDYARAEWTGAVAEKSWADSDYEVQRAYAILIGAVFLAHIFVLWIARRRQRAVTTHDSN
jgi:hypothetical protein